MVNETSDRPRLTPKGARTRARIVEEAAALIHERGVATPPWKMSKRRRKSAALGMYHSFPDKNELLQAVIDHQADAIVNNQGRCSAARTEVETWRNMVITEAKRTKARGFPWLARWSIAECDPEAQCSLRQGSISGQQPSAMYSDPFMRTGSSRRGSTRTTSPLLFSPRSKEDFSRPGATESSPVRDCGQYPSRPCYRYEPGSVFGTRGSWSGGLPSARRRHSGDGPDGVSPVGDDVSSARPLSVSA